MDVAALLSPPFLAYLGRVLGPQHTVSSASGWGELGVLVRRTPVDVIVVDPLAQGGAAVDEIVALSRRHPSIPVVVYTGFSPASMRATVELANHGLTEVVLRGYDDEPPRFAALLAQQTTVDLSEELVRLLAEPLALLPPPVAEALRRVLRRPASVATGDALARSAGVSRSTLYRSLDEAGLAAPKTFLRAARLLRAYVYLSDSSLNVADVAARVGYATKDRLRIRVRSAFGVRTRHLRRVRPDALVQTLAAMLRAEGDAGDDSADGAAESLPSWIQ